MPWVLGSNVVWRRRGDEHLESHQESRQQARRRRLEMIYVLQLPSNISKRERKKHAGLQHLRILNKRGKLYRPKNYVAQDSFSDSIMVLY